MAAPTSRPSRPKSSVASGMFAGWGPSRSFWNPSCQLRRCGAGADQDADALVTSAKHTPKSVRFVTGHQIVRTLRHVSRALRPDRQRAWRIASIREHATGKQHEPQVFWEAIPLRVSYRKTSDPVLSPLKCRKLLPTVFSPNPGRQKYEYQRLSAREHVHVGRCVPRKRAPRVIGRRWREWSGLC
jgi:hypothetical protein